MREGDREGGTSREVRARCHFSLVHYHHQLTEHLAHQGAVTRTALSIPTTPLTLHSVHHLPPPGQAVVVFRVEQVDLVADHEERHRADVATLGYLVAHVFQILERFHVGQIQHQHVCRGVAQSVPLAVGQLVHTADREVGQCRQVGDLQLVYAPVDDHRGVVRVSATSGLVVFVEIFPHELLVTKNKTEKQLTMLTVT